MTNHVLRPDDLHFSIYRKKDCFVAVRLHNPGFIIEAKSASLAAMKAESALAFYRRSIRAVTGEA